MAAAGAKFFFLPKYSPDLNSIEMLFSKLKHDLRKTAKRTLDVVYQASPTRCLPSNPSKGPTSSSKDVLRLRVTLL